MLQFSDPNELHDAREHLDFGAFQRAVDAKLERSLVGIAKEAFGAARF